MTPEELRATLAVLKDAGVKSAGFVSDRLVTLEFWPPPGTRVVAERPALLPGETPEERALVAMVDLSRKAGAAGG